jgi:short subunit dehydrogenase-like uncharacterized protein
MRSGFMIYGAYGYTGELIARQAVRRGHRPLLAGRQGPKLAALGRELGGLPWVTVALEDQAGLVAALARVSAVCHAAGPFVHTSEPLLDACLLAGTHYLDITGEIPVFEAVFRRSGAARERGIALIPGVGFDVVPSDCLARFVAEQLPGASELEIAFAVEGSLSRGTAQSSFEGLLRGNFVRKDGKLVEVPLGHGLHEVRFSDRARSVLPIPWGDLVTAFHTTAIPNITTSMALPAALARALPLARPALPGLVRLLGKAWLRRWILSSIATHVAGPDDRARSEGRTRLWARASNREGQVREAWLDTVDGYAFTAESAVLALEALALAPRRGALTPASAFGADFVLQVSGTERREQPLPAGAR